MSEIPFYISLTTMFQRQRQCRQTLESLLQQSLQPKKIFVFVSEKPYLLDKGIRQFCLDPSLTELTMKYPQIEVEWVENEGPFRKLLPFLRKNWSKENRIVITCDDDVIYKKDFCKMAIDLWRERQCCIGFEGSQIRPSFDYNSFPSAKGTQHLWNLATGVGGILYETKWFINKEFFNWKEFPFNDDLWFTSWRIAANIECYVHSISSIERTFAMKEGQTLWSSFNSTKNSSALEKILHLFVYKGYIQNQESFFPRDSQILFEWNAYIQTKLLPLLKTNLEGSIWNKHLTNQPDSSLLPKQQNILHIGKTLSGKKVCEVGFNAGFSTLLLLLANPNITVQCLDLGEHSYTLPAFQQLQKDFGERIQLLLGDSQTTMKTLSEGYDFVHVDGGHTESIALSDCREALRILNSKGLLLLDDTNLTAVQKGMQPFLSQVEEVPLPNALTNYEHKLYRKKV